MSRIVITTVLVAALGGCVVETAPAPYAGPGPYAGPAYAGPAQYAPPAGVAYVAPGYASPGAGYIWRYHRHYGWGWWHPRYGWHRRWAGY